MITRIRKRDGREASFSVDKIAAGIYRAAQSIGGSDYSTSYSLAEMAANRLDGMVIPGQIPDVEQLQDVVEKVLVETGHAGTARSYILYRAARSRISEMHSRLM